MSLSTLCGGYHSVSANAWLCVTTVDGNEHRHLCGIHARMYRNLRNLYVFRALRAPMPPHAEFLSGVGCAIPRDAPSTDLPPSRSSRRKIEQIIEQDAFLSRRFLEVV